MMLNRLTIFLIPILSATLLAGCASTSSRPSLGECKRYLGAGAVLGGIAGYLAADEVSGDKTTDAERAAVTAAGAAGGAGVAYLLCARAYKHKQDLEQRFAALEAELAAERAAREAADAALAESDEPDPEDSPIRDLAVEKNTSGEYDVHEIHLDLDAGILFAIGSAKLRSSDQPYLDALAESILANPVEKIVLVGYTDNTGSEELNLRLSQQRAEAVANYLARRGVDPARLEAQGVGESSPIASNATEEGRAQNRRVEIVIVPDASAS